MLSSATFQALPGLTGRNWKSPFSSDASESVTPPFRQEIADTLDLGFQSLRTSRRKSLHLYPFKVANLGCCAGGLTFLFDTIVFASDFLSPGGDAHAQKVLIRFSDGIDTISRSSFGNSVDASIRNDIPVDCIHLTLRSGSSQGADALRGFGATGGRYFPLPNDASRTLNVILEGFKQAVK